MTQKELIEEVEQIAEKFIDKKYQEPYKKIIVENYMKFLDNERTVSDKEKLLKILKNVTWYSNHNTDVFFSNIITEILDEIIGDIFFICKDKKNSSCYNIVLNLEREGKLERKNIITYNKITKTLQDKKIKEKSTILIVDDYAGSGNTIIDMINAIEEKYVNMNVHILIYVWQEAGIERIKEHLKSDFNNNYEIIEKGIVLENSYEEKFNEDNDSIEYIKNICDNCKSDDFRYGYMETGSMLTFNGISPNNNISMLWRSDINYNECKWSPVFNREYSLEYLRKKKNEYLINNKRGILKIYNNSDLKSKVTFEQFKVLIILFNTYSVRLEHIKDLLGFDNIEEVQNIIENFVNCGIISYSIDNILEFIDTEVIKEMKRVDQKISRNVGIIKGTRKQISKFPPLE